MLLDGLIVGFGIRALVECYNTGKSLVLTRYQNPYFFENSNEKIIKKDIETHSLHDAWNYLVFLLSLRGQIVNPASVEKIFFLDSSHPEYRRMKECSN